MSDEEMSVENLIFNQKGRLDLSNEDLANRMSGILGEKLSGQGVGHYFADNAGIPLKKLGAFLKALGLKVVPQEEICLTPEKMKALKLLARESLEEKE